MATTPVRLVTAEELFERGEEWRHYELVQGELREVSPASPRSSEIGILVAWWLVQYVRPRRLGKVYGSEAGFILQRGPDVVRAPDVAFVRADRLPGESEQHFFLELAPDLAVEVVSPSDRLVDVNEKVQEYLHAGVKLVWVIEPRSKRVTVYLPDRSARTLGTDDVLDGGSVLPGFQLPLGDLFS